MQVQADNIDLAYVQGTAEWLELRKNKITATDSCIIMGASHWKTKIQLYYEKTSATKPMPPNERMQRGLDLEPIARDLFTIKTGIQVSPAVIVKGWMMASLDGRSELGNHIVEIKCPGPLDHAKAVAGHVPDHYYPQLQHQMTVCDLDSMYYFSFDGYDGVIVEVERNFEYCEKMIEEERKFYKYLLDGTTPEPEEDDYIQRDDDLWAQYASKWKTISMTLKELEEVEQDLRKQLIFLSGESNTRGVGISLCEIKRKGHIDYAQIPELKGVDLEKYRKASTTSWRITSH